MPVALSEWQLEQVLSASSRPASTRLPSSMARSASGTNTSVFRKPWASIFGISDVTPMPGTSRPITWLEYTYCPATQGLRIDSRATSSGQRPKTSITTVMTAATPETSARGCTSVSTK